MIHAFGGGLGLAVRGIVFQGGAGAGQGLAFGIGQGELVRVKYAGIVEAPLQDVVDGEAWCAAWPLTEFGHGLFKVGEGQRALGIAE